MGKIIRNVLLTLLALILVLIIAFVVVYFTRLRTMATIEKHSDYPDGFNMYSMTVKYDYDVNDILNSGYTDTQGFVNEVIKEALPLLPIKMEMPSFGCSTYRAFNPEGDAIMGRNYDFKLDTSCMAVFCEPKNGYKSISFCALNNFSACAPETSIVQKMACLAAPFGVLDGVNEKGVSMAVLTLDSEPTDQNTGKQKITSSLIIRMVLDSCATTQEAVELMKQYDMLAVNGRDYHYFISDASGDSVVVEYDCEVPERTLTVTPMPAITNFFGMYIDKVESNQRNGMYGHGKERYDKMMAIIEPNNDILDNENAWAALQNASSAPNPESVTSNTQWSIIFNNAKGTADITIRRHWGDVFSFAIAK